MSFTRDIQSEKLLEEFKSQCHIDQNVRILREVEAFAVVPINKLRVLATLFSRKKFVRNSFLFRQHDRDPHGYIIIEGIVQIYRHYTDKSYMLQELTPHDFFGGLALFADIKRLFSAKAATDVTCLVIDRETFHRFTLNFPEVATRVLETMIKRVVALEDKLLDMQIVECRYE
ncbi:MAG: Crp/Fnr family transcriptional regulator [Deltaproteobacteria bacterium]|nr:Crp/Fnr family transcriptional regulator [Deltaproteobacteria bacterium]MBW2069054.1 Crp/Fnr family transcriptional regulator [Deltaproteobacteria bacterium]